ncbi:unnamed protein product [Dicrocoelium dendriticum]|nr:unnamed protein product [Dicrocoelium dendriticum]
MPKSTSQMEDESQKLDVDPGLRISVALESLSDALQKMTTNQLPTASAPPLPPTDRFSPGMSYSRWEKQAQLYLKNFPVAQHGTVIMGLLSHEAFDIVADTNLLEEPVTPETFASLRRLLDRPGLPDELRKAFHARYQRPGENVGTYARELRRMALSAYVDETQEQQGKRVLEQLLEGIQTPSVKREFRLRRPTCLQAALEVADQLEQVDASMGLMEPCCALNRYRPASSQPPGRRNWNRVPYRGPVQSYFRRPHPHPPRRGNFPPSLGRRNLQGECDRVKSVFIPAVTSATSALSLMVELIVAGVPLVGLIDTGACRSLVRANITQSLTDCVWTPCYYHLTVANGEPLPVRESITVQVHLANEKFRHEFIVADNLPFAVIIGMDLLRRLKCRLDLDKCQLITDSCVISLRQGHADSLKTFTIGGSPSDEEDRVDTFIRSLAVPTDERTLGKLKEVLLAHSDAFAWQTGDLGRTSVVKHLIDTGNTTPIKTHPRRIPVHWQGELQKLIDEMLKKEVIRPSTSPWAAPVVLVKKKDGGFRLCVDYRRLNEVTRKDAYPLPRIDDLFDTLGGSAYFSTLDLVSGYWQVEVEESDRAKTAFVIPSGLYEFQTMPFGLSNAPATFQRLMQKVLHDLIPHKCLVYLDDVIVHGRTKDEHLSNLAEVLTCLINVGLKLQPKNVACYKKKLPISDTSSLGQASGQILARQIR